MKLTLFFTFGVSLRDWAKSGLLQREIRLYQELVKAHDISVTFITYGDAEDYEFREILGDIEIIPVFDRIHRPGSKVLVLATTLLIPWVYRKKLQEADIYKTNQQWGSWVSVLSSWLWRKPLLLRCGYEPLKNSYHEGGGGPRQWLMRLISYIAYSRADMILLTTNEIADFVINTFNTKASTYKALNKIIDKVSK